MAKKTRKAPAGRKPPGKGRAAARPKARRSPARVVRKAPARKPAPARKKSSKSAAKASPKAGRGAAPKPVPGAAVPRKAPAREAEVPRSRPEAPVARPRPAAPPVGPQTLALPPVLASEVRGIVEEWAAGEKMARLWKGDSTLWTGKDEDRWVGWLRIIDQQRARREEFARVSEDVRLAGFTSVVVLGMGGSSLCPDVLARVFGHVPGHPQLRVLDSTVPAQVRALDRELDLRRTLFIVSSKSGSTVEPSVFLAYYLERVKSLMGADAGSRFIAITDPGSDLEKQALREGFRKVFHGVPSIGGRYSALSHFGMVPAAAMGLNVSRMLDRAARMADACGADHRGEDNPGLVLGVVLGVAALGGRDKLTLVVSPGLANLGDWLEQLVAESLGKHGKGVVPVAGEALGQPRSYGEDRLFVQVRLASAPSAEQDRAVAALERAGFPVVRIDVADPSDLAQEFFRWEVATAVAGAILGVNPFDQPDVEAAKAVARRMMAAYDETGALPPEQPVLEGEGLRLFVDPAGSQQLSAEAREQTPAGWIRSHLSRLGKGDYLAVNAFLEMSPQNQALLQEIREAIRASSHDATTLGFGPRFLHSTGQLHKGGPGSGVFLVITADDAERVAIPGRRADFGVLARAQARGDQEVLAERGRRVLRVHLGADVKAGLSTLRRLVQKGT